MSWTCLSWGTSRIGTGPYNVFNIHKWYWRIFLSLSRLFADDTSLGYSSQSVDQIKTVINHDLLELNACSSKWLISFNPEKNEIMFFFSNTGNTDNLEFSFNGKIIPFSTSHKHLGVILFQNAKWNEHLENMITNITKHLGILRN